MIYNAEMVHDERSPVSVSHDDPDAFVFNLAESIRSHLERDEDTDIEIVISHPDPKKPHVGGGPKR